MQNGSTLLELRTRAKRRADMENSGFISDAEWNDYLNCYRLPRPDESILIIPEYVLCYLFNGDHSCLTTDELAQCDRLCDDWQYFTVLSEPYFSPTNDLNTLGGNCVDLAALPVTND